MSTEQNAQQAIVDSVVAQLKDAQANNTQLTTVVGNIKGDIDNLNTEIAKLQEQQQNGQPLDLSALVAVGASLQQTSASVLTAAEAVDAETPEVPPTA